jgi:ABC-2 type transport system ATP-binding protein
VTAAEPAVRVERLVRRFGDVVAVDGLSFEVRPGELFGLLGPDGAGKTTTLRMLAGVLRPTSGDATVAGASVARRPEAAKPYVAYMSQRFGLYADLTVRENLDFYADLYRVPKGERAARLERLYSFSNLGPFQQRLAGKLSGGMKQKLGLSCALLHEPEILLLDEPTFGVDPISRRDLWIIVHEMVSRGVTAVVSTAYMDEAERFDRVALLDRGRMLALDTPETLQRGLEGRVRALRCDRSRAAQKLAERLPGVRAAAVFGEDLHVVFEGGPAPPAAHEAAAALRAALAGAEIRVQDERPIRASMEDVFIDRLAAAARAAS